MSRLRLDDVEWKEFNIGGEFGLFKVGGTITTHPSNLQSFGNTPRVTCSATNNAVENFYCNTPTEKGGVLTVDSATEGYVSYQLNDFIATDHVEKIFLEDKKINKYVGLFLKSCIDKSKLGKYGYGYKFSQKRISRQKIMLPIDSKGNPNWQFMKDYVKQEMKEQSQKIVRYYENKLLKLGFELLDLEVEWKYFKVKDIFTLLKRGSTTPKEVVFGKNKYTYIGAKYNNNGVVDFVDQGKVFKGNAICFVMTGEGSVGKSFYKKENFVPSNNIYVGYFDDLDEYIANFLVTLINNQSSRYNYGYIRNTDRLKNEILKLPIDKNGNPHWEYMRLFMQKLEKENISKVLEYIYIYRLASVLKDKYSIDNVQWNEYFIENICEIKSGVRLIKNNQADGLIPFIGSVDHNNGITNFISNINSSLDKNVLGVNYNGSVVETFYHPYDCIFSDDVKRVSFKDKNYNDEYTLLFLKQMIIQQKEKYQYGYKFNGKRMSRQKIMLPSKKDGSVDVDFMKKYMIIQEVELIEAVLNHYS